MGRQRQVCGHLLQQPLETHTLPVSSCSAGPSFSQALPPPSRKSTAFPLSSVSLLLSQIIFPAASRKEGCLCGYTQWGHITRDLGDHVHWFCWWVWRSHRSSRQALFTLLWLLPTSSNPCQRSRAPSARLLPGLSTPESLTHPDTGADLCFQLPAARIMPCN